MSLRKLQALDHPNPSLFNVEDEAEFRKNVLWLEDQKIRHYKIEDRADLRNLTDSIKWNKAFLQYIQDVQCPYTVEGDGRSDVVDWLLGLAVRLEFGDNVESYRSGNNDSKIKSQPDNPLSNLDFNSPDAKAGIMSLTHLLNIPPHPDHIEMLKAICMVIVEKFSAESIAKAKSSSVNNKSLQLDSIQLGFETGDYIANDAAKILRLLHIRNLRDLQTQINAAIVAVQGVTANPKTDTRLGKVGR